MSVARHLAALAGWILLALWMGRVRNDLPHDRHFFAAVVLIVSADAARAL